MAGLSSVSLTDFDRGVVTSFGASLIDVVIDATTRKSYAAEVSGVASEVEGFGGKVPVFFEYPDDVYQEYVLPCYVIRRTELTPNFEGASWFGYNACPSASSKLISIPHPRLRGVSYSGYDSYTSRRNADPFDLGYDVSVMGRYQYESIPMLRHIMRYMRPPGFGLRVLDSSGVARMYSTTDVSASAISELSDVRSRMIAWTVSFVVKGELDHALDVNHKVSGGGVSGDIVTSLPEVTYRIKRV